MTLSREEWLTERRTHIGASDVAAILGMDPRRGPLAVYESKVHGHSQEDNDWMRFGRDVEGAIANMYAAKTKRDVEDLGGTWFQPHSSVSFLSSTLDRVTWEAPTDPDEPGAALELKHVGNFSNDFGRPRAGRRWRWIMKHRPSLAHGKRRRDGENMTMRPWRQLKPNSAPPSETPRGERSRMGRSCPSRRLKGRVTREWSSPGNIGLCGG